MQTRRVTRETQDLWRRMGNTGVPLRDRLSIDPPGLTIEQFGGIHESQIFTLPGGVGIGYIIWLRVVPIRPGIQIERWELTLDQPDPHFQWLQASAERNGHFIFPRGPEYPPEHVLYHRVECPLERPLRGGLLAFGGRPIPERYPHGSFMELEVLAFDQHDQRYPTQVKLWVSRFTELHSKASKKQVRSSLFERDAVPAGASVHPAVRPPTSSPANQSLTLLDGNSYPSRRRVSVAPEDTLKPPGGKPNQIGRPARRLE